MKHPALQSAAALLVTGMLASACDSTPPRGPGSIFISATSQIPEPGAFFQYQIAVDNGTPRMVNPFEGVSYLVNGLAHGPHTVELSGLPTSCSAGAARRDVNLRGDDTALVVFSVQCTRTTGDLRVAVTTTGPSPDLDGYLVSIDQMTAAMVQPNGQVTMQFVSPGVRAVSLSGVATNCSGGATQSVTVTAGALATANFTVTCSPVAILKVASSSSGQDRDADGLMLRLDQGAASRVSGTTYVRVAAGTHSWEISDIQPNCALDGASSGSVTIAAGDTVTLVATATCSAIGYGAAGTTAVDAAADTLSNALGNASPAHDIVQMTTRYATNWLIIVMRFARPVGAAGLATPGGLQGLIELDTDENASTGIPPLLNSYGGSAQQGVDHQIALFEADSGSVRIRRFTMGLDTIAHRVPLKLEGDSVLVFVPLAKLGGDDGNMTITTIVGTQDRPTDIAPNAGVILARQPTGTVIANAVSGIDVAATVRRRPTKWPPR